MDNLRVREGFLYRELDNLGMALKEIAELQSGDKLSHYNMLQKAQAIARNSVKGLNTFKANLDRLDALLAKHTTEKKIERTWQVKEEE